ncbi:hypothetical protein AB1Y20_001103 [Prymnesium parvum]|uniref:FAD dependent oxidoreductase domain-containing protein n=1 Tax=Prymnesium parvum TaxID=97485 RepID=A0AB34KA31_PRYPA
MVVICGGGIIGTSIAYYLAKRGVVSTVVDRVGICPAASGKAGGFLALDWNDGGPVGPLTRKSFELHAFLAEELNARTDYRRLTCQAISVTGGSRGPPKQAKLQGVEWADLGLVGSRPLGDESTIAQVHPKLLGEALWAEAAKAGCKLRIGQVDGVERSEGRVVGVSVDGEVIPTDKVVIAMGPWSDLASEWLGIPRTYGQKYHSVLMKPERVLSQAVFFQGASDPEVYPRPDGTVYVTGFPDPPGPVRENPGEVEVRADVVAKLTKSMTLVSSELGNAPVVLEQSCYLPCSPDGDPIIGAVPNLVGAYVATGHSCWGILNAPATGLAMSELIIDGHAASVDLTAFSPSRFG